MTESYELIVIGGGHNGLTTAAYAAKAGRKVLVVEARDTLGGVGGGYEFHPGYRSPGILHDTRSVRPWVIQDLQLKNHGLKVRAEETPVFFPDKEGGRGILLWDDPAKAEEEIGPYSSKDAASYKEYRQTIRKLTPFVRKVFDDFPPELTGTSFTGYLELMKKAVSLRLLGKDDMMELLRIAPMCVADWLGEFFDGQLLKAGLAGPSIYNTFCGPWSPGTNANLLLAECLAWQPIVGGPAALTSALAKAAQGFGATIKTGQAVKRLQFDGRKVIGVELEDGSQIAGQRVAASCDPRTLLLDLVPTELLSHGFERNVLNYRMRGTAAKIHLAVKDYPQWKCRPGVKAEYIRLGTSMDGLERAFDAIKYRQISERPALEIYIPSVEDPSYAASGGHVLSILVSFAPIVLDGGWNEQSKQTLFDRAMTVLEDYAPGVKASVVASEVLSPSDFERDYRLSGGQLHHGEHAADQLLIRPFPECAHYKTPFEGLYICGAGGHPGGGITCAPGALAAKALLHR